MVSEEMKQSVENKETESVETEKKVSETKTTFRVIKGCKLLNVRKEPSLDSVVVGVLREGEAFVSTKSSLTNGFYKVSKGHLVGYCKKEFVEPLKSKAKETKEE